ncbi:MAG: CapA family protein [Hyphomicrobiaceae bacterium]
MARAIGRAARLPAVLALVACVGAGGDGAVSAEAEMITFREPCEAGTRITVAAVGDLLFHKRLQLEAYAKGRDFRQFWEPVADILAGADLTYGNLEGPVADGVAVGGRAAKKDPGRRLDGIVYSADLKTLNFNYHPSVIPDLIASGFDLVSTANNHAMDRGVLGIDRTVDNLDRYGLPFTGTRKAGETTRAWSVVTRADGLNVAWLACTYSLNGMPDRKSQVLFCFEEREWLLAEIRKLASDPAVDAVMVTPHWGIEDSHGVEQRARALARDMIDAGATAVIGAHPHVLQPWEKVVARDGREGLVIYSLGNFVSNQRKLPQRTGAIALIELTKPATGGRARVTAAGFIPTWVEIDGRGHRAVELTGGRGQSMGVLKAALRLLPDGNRVLSSSLPHLPGACRAVAEAAAPESP